MEVPQTPLHTSRVLKEEKDAWEDVKVRHLVLFASVLLAKTIGKDVYSCMIATLNRKLVCLVG